MITLHDFPGEYMKNEGYKYMLRYTADPGHHIEDHLDQLVEFCLNAKIDDVMFFINGEQLNRGHLTFDETKPWMDAISKGKVMLDGIGVTTSINPWPTLMHSDKGRTFTNGLVFNWMADGHGNLSKAVACPAHPVWRRYISEMYAYYASIKPHLLWIEDDFRHFNHGDPLVWGGCFCDFHMEEFSKKAGRKLTREEFFRGILQPGVPHPYRKIWLDTAREEMIETARLIGEAVHQVSPATKIGLMSSGPADHCTEARDWKGVLKAFAGETPMVNRTHLPAYTDISPHEYMWSFNTASRVTRTMMPAETEIYPELENIFDTRYTKSHKLMEMQMDTSLLLGAKGITLNIFDMMGNGVIIKEGLDKVLSGRKDFLDVLAGLGLYAGRQKGVKVLVSQDSAYNVHTFEGRRMEELYPNEYFWASFLPMLGITAVPTAEPLHSGSFVAVSGQYFRNLDEKALNQLFSDNFILLDGEAALTLFDMGYGKLAGITGAVRHSLDSGFKSFEQVCDGENYCGLADARISSPYDAVAIRYSDGAAHKTVIKDQYYKTVCPGITVYDSRVMILPCALRDCYDGHWNLNSFRREIIQKILLDADNDGQLAYVFDSPYVVPYLFDMGLKTALVLVNSSHDDLGEIRFAVRNIDIGNAHELNRDENCTISTVIVRDDDCTVIKSGLRSMEMKVLLFEKNSCR